LAVCKRGYGKLSVITTNNMMIILVMKETTFADVFFEAFSEKL
jgi:hypothetical protein